MRVAKARQMDIMRAMKYVLVFIALCATAAGQMRVGIIGTDTSHVTAFTKVLNDPSAPDHIPGARIVPPL